MRISIPNDVGHYNHPLLGPNVLAGNSHGLVHAPPISDWAIALIPYVTAHHTYDTILSAFGFPEPDFPEVTHSSIAPA
ncbi:hypothetical protein SLA2020_369550 [Shorea laevis]